MGRHRVNKPITSWDSEGEDDKKGMETHFKTIPENFPNLEIDIGSSKDPKEDYC